MISCPVLRGSWDTKVKIADDWLGKSVNKMNTMIRIVGPAYLCLPFCEVDWIDNHV